MAARRKKRRRPALVSAYLEGVSAKTLESHQDVIRELIAREQGVYALYKGSRLYYVGLASDLRGRIRQHLRDKHAGKWSSFSLYLVRHVDHIQEIESLLLRIADPGGNAHRGRLSRATNLKPTVRKAVRDRWSDQLDELLGPSDRSITRASVQRRTRDREVTYPLQGLFARRRLYATYKGKDYKARVLSSGQIEYRGRRYDTPTAAAKAIVKRRVHGWNFWWVRDNGELVRLRDHPETKRRR